MRRTPSRSPRTAEIARRYPTQSAGGRGHLELWVPAEELAEFNRHIVGRVEVLSAFGAAA